MFSLSPTFAIDDIEDNLDSQSIVESHTSSDEKLELTNETINKNIEQSVEKDIEINSNNEEILNTEDVENKDNFFIQKEIEKDIILNKENIDNVIDNNKNTIDLTQDKGNIKANTILSSDTTLKTLNFYFTNGELTEPFSPNQKNYTALIKGNDTTFRFTNNSIKTNSDLATMDIYFNKELVFNDITGTTDKMFTLVKGETNVLEIIVKAENGDKDTYTVTFKREGYSDSKLKKLGFLWNNPYLTDTFDPDKKEYTAIVKGNDTIARFFTDTTATKDPYATMDIYLNDEIGLENIVSTPDKTFVLKKGTVNVMKIIVTAESGDSTTYTVTFKREGEDDSKLKKLGFLWNSPYLTETFDPNKEEYTAIVKDKDTSVRFFTDTTATKDPYATMNIYFNNELVLENITSTPDKTFSLIKGVVNVMQIVVTAENGDSTTYTVTFKREGSCDASLASIGFPWNNSNVELTENFNADVKDYTAIVKGNQSSIRFFTGNISVKDPYATMDVYFNDQLVFENVTKTTDKTFQLEKNKKNITTIIVTSEDGNQSTYTVTFEREGYNDTSLASIGFPWNSDRVNLTESFNADLKDYTAIVKGNQNGIRFFTGNISVKDPYATMDVYFNDQLVFEKVTKTIDKTLYLEKGKKNIVTIIVTAENKDQSIYTVTFERELDSNTNITNLSMNKGSLKLESGTYTATMNSWQDISLSKLVLEDSWANYKLILNDKKEIALNEKFNLEIGDNKLDIEITSNNGTKKTYPVIFERTDNTKPTVNFTVDNLEWTNEDILINLKTSDDSGIRYIELPDGEKVYLGNTSFMVTQNGRYVFKIYDNFLNETIEVVEIKNIDKELPKLELKASTTELTNSSVDISIKASDNIAIKHIETPNGDLVNESSFNYSVCEDGTYSFKVVDHVGNEFVKSITLNNIDSVNPVLATELSNEDWSNEELTLSVFAMSNKGIKYIELPDGTKVEDNFAEYGISENGTYFIATESLGGNVTSEKVVVNNIDTELPTLILSPSTEDWTNEDVDVIVNAEDNIGIDYILLPDGQTVVDSKCTYSVESNGVYEFAVFDLAGNKTTESIEVKNIDKNPPAIENYDDLVAILNNIITLDLSTIETPSGIHKVILPNKEEVIEPGDNIIKYEVKYNDTYRFVVVDKAGNSIDVDVEVDTLINKEDESVIDKIGSTLESLPNTGGMYSVVLFTSIGLILGGAVTLLRRR